MIMSIDGRIHPSRFNESPDGTRKEWSGEYEKLHDTLGADAWLVGRVTMAEMSKGVPHPPAGPFDVERPHHFAQRTGKYAIAFDRSGKLHFNKPDIGGDHVVVLLGPGVSEEHLAELTNDGVSYIVAADDAMDPKTLFEILAKELGIKKLVVEGGGNVNGALLAAGVIDELSMLVAPAIDGALGITGVFEVADPKGVAGKIRTRFLSCETLGHGVVHLRYGVEAI